MPPDDPGLRDVNDALVLDKPPPASPGPVFEPAHTASAQALKILILEDEPTDAELMQRALRKAGLDFTARRVDNRAGFIAALETFAPDIVLSDYRLPGFNGAASRRKPGGRSTVAARRRAAFRPRRAPLPRHRLRPPLNAPA